jgi:hypothetical protein
MRTRPAPERASFWREFARRSSEPEYPALWDEWQSFTTVFDEPAKAKDLLIAPGNRSVLRLTYALLG